MDTDQQHKGMSVWLLSWVEFCLCRLFPKSFGDSFSHQRQSLVLADGLSSVSQFCYWLTSRVCVKVTIATAVCSLCPTRGRKKEANLIQELICLVLCSRWWFLKELIHLFIYLFIFTWDESNKLFDRHRVNIKFILQVIPQHDIFLTQYWYFINIEEPYVVSLNIFLT